MGHCSLMLQNFRVRWRTHKCIMLPRSSCLRCTKYLPMMRLVWIIWIFQWFQSMPCWCLSPSICSYTASEPEVELWTYSTLALEWLWLWMTWDGSGSLRKILSSFEDSKSWDLTGFIFPLRVWLRSYCFLCCLSSLKPSSKLSKFPMVQLLTAAWRRRFFLWVFLLRDQQPLFMFFLWLIHSIVPLCFQAITVLVKNFPSQMSHCLPQILLPVWNTLTQSAEMYPWMALYSSCSPLTLITCPPSSWVWKWDWVLNDI